MNRRILAATASATALAVTLAACEPTPAGPSHSAPAGSSQSQNAAAAPSCTVDYGPDKAGIRATGHKVDATVALICTATPTDVLVSLTLTYTAPGTSPADDRKAAAADYLKTRTAYTASAECHPGSYALHVLYGATVDGVALSSQVWGETAVVTAADCARA